VTTDQREAVGCASAAREMSMETTATGGTNVHGGSAAAGRPGAATAALVFVGLLAVYLINGDFLPGDDATPNVYLPVSILNEGNLTCTPAEMPFMFHWALETPAGRRPIPQFRRWDEDPRLTRLYADGTLKVAGAQYYLVPTRRAGEYVGQYGPGAGLTALPVFAALHVLGGNLADQPQTLWYAAKFVAAILTAASGAFVFLTAARFVPRRQALLIAAAYGLGTSVWSIASQTLWQHGPNVFFLALGTCGLVRIEDGRKFAALCGAAFAAAMACRPTSAFYVVAVGAYLLIAHRRALGPYLVAGLPIIVALAAYNACFLGSPVDFGQAERGAAIAQYKTGSAEVWRWSAMPGHAAGQLFSPSRGLLVYSPFVVFAVWGAWRAWRDGSYAVLRPLTAGVVLTMLVSFAWFDWWGGWSYGPRLLVDTMPMLALFLVPVMERVVRSRAALAVFVVLVGWSVYGQVLGAFAYDLQGWNAPKMFEVRVPGEDEPRRVADETEARRLAQADGVERIRVVHEDVDRPEFRHRLWSITDSPIVYYTAHFVQARKAKHEMMNAWTQR